MAGVVFYKGGDLRCFPADTAIQPDNCVPIPHTTVAEARERSRLEVREILPDDFDARLQKAIDNSVTLDDRKRERLARIRKP
jgi:hypothetical protein